MEPRIEVVTELHFSDEELSIVFRAVATYMALHEMIADTVTVIWEWDTDTDPLNPRGAWHVRVYMS